MVEAADFANRDDPAEFWLLDWPAVGRILVERQVSACPVVVLEVASQGTAEVLFAEDDDVIQTLAPDRADEALREGVLPRAVRRRQDFTDAHALEALPEHVPVDRVAVAEEVGRGGVVREGVHDLLGRPGRGGMLGDIEVEEPSRLSRRRQSLRGWGHDESESVFPGGPGAGGADGIRARVGACLAVGGDHVDRREDRVRGRDAAKLGAAGRA